MTGGGDGLFQPGTGAGTSNYNVLRALPGSGFTVHVRFTARNAAGADVVSDKLFSLDKDGDIVAVADFKPHAAPHAGSQ